MKYTVAELAENFTHALLDRARHPAPRRFVTAYIIRPGLQAIVSRRAPEKEDALVMPVRTRVRYVPHPRHHGDPSMNERTIRNLFVLAALAGGAQTMLGCSARAGSSPITEPTDVPPFDVPLGDVVLALDASVVDVPTPPREDVSAPPPDVSAPPPKDVPAPGVDANTLYPPGPYTSSVGGTFRPFTLNRCDGTPWSFADEGWASSRLTVIIICAGWVIPCQREAAQIQAQLVDSYRGRGVRVVSVLVQDQNRNAINNAFCSTWVNRYNLQIPVLQDPSFSLQPFVPNATFPGNLIIDRQARIRWRQYGADTSLGTVRAAIEDVLANPDP